MFLIFSSLIINESILISGNLIMRFSKGSETAIDEIDLIWQKSKNEIRAKFELPFNGHILFALTLLIAAGNKEFIRILVFYQLVLLIILPLLGLLFLNGRLWLAIILKFHEKAHKNVFIILGVISIKSAASGLSIKKS